MAASPSPCSREKPAIKKFSDTDASMAVAPLSLSGNSFAHGIAGIGSLMKDVLPCIASLLVQSAKPTPAQRALMADRT